MAKIVPHQTIETRFLPATDTKPARIKAFAEAGSITESYAFEGDKQHAEVAQKLAEKLGWTGPRYGQLYGGASGGKRGRGYTFLLIAGVDETLNALEVAEATIQRLAPDGSRATQGTRDVINAAKTLTKL